MHCMMLHSHPALYILVSMMAQGQLQPMGQTQNFYSKHKASIAALGFGAWGRNAPLAVPAKWWGQ